MINFILPIRIVQAIFAIIILGLTAFVIDDTNGFFDSVNFLLFASIWSFLVLAYLVVTPMFAPSMHNRWAVVGVEGVTMIFWFAGFVAVAAKASDFGDCFHSELCSVEKSMKAAAVFGASEWLAWCISLGLLIHAMIQYRNSAGAEQHMETSINPESILTSISADAKMDALAV